MTTGSGFVPLKFLLESHYVIASIRCGRKPIIYYVFCMGPTVVSENQFSFKILRKWNAMAQLTVGLEENSLLHASLPTFVSFYLLVNVAFHTFTENIPVLVAGQNNTPWRIRTCCCNDYAIVWCGERGNQRRTATMVLCKRWPFETQCVFFCGGSKVMVTWETKPFYGNQACSYILFKRGRFLQKLTQVKFTLPTSYGRDW